MKPGIYLNNINNTLFECHGTGKFGLPNDMVANWRLPYFPYWIIDDNTPSSYEQECLDINDFEVLLMIKAIEFIGEV